MKKRNLEIFRLFVNKSIFYSRGNKNVDLKEEILVIIQSKHFCVLEFTLKALKLKCLKQ
jgi:hypothetical protein